MVEIKKIAYCQITNNYWAKEGLKNFQKAKPFVDFTILVHDGIDEDVKKQFEELGTIIIEKPLEDNFAQFRQYYVDKARELGADYLLWSDTDEHFDDQLLSALRQITFLNPQFNGFEVYCHYEIPGIEKMDIKEIEREAPGGTAENTNWWKLCMVRLQPDMKYDGVGPRHNTHEHIVANDWNVIKLPRRYFFTQYKTAEQIWRNCARQIVISGGGLGVTDKNVFYNELMPILKELNVDQWSIFEQYCQKGNIDQRIKDVIIKHRSDSKYRWDSEVRSVFKWYFLVLHPEENTENLKSEFISAEYLDGVHDLVRKTYFQCLGRDSDESGLEYYISKVTTGELQGYQLPKIFTTSDEYIKNNVNTSFFNVVGRGATQIELDTWGACLRSGDITNIENVLRILANVSNLRLAYCQMTYKGDLEDTIENVKNAKDHVDVCIVVYDNTLDEADVKLLKDAGAHARYYNWHDNFPEMRNNYLQEARLYGVNWCLVSDPDEHFDSFLLKSARMLAKQAEAVGCNMLMVPVHDIFTDDEAGKKLDTPIELIPDYRKNLFFKLTPEVWYVGVGETKNLHETMTGNFRTTNLDKLYFYRHVKSHVEIWEHAVRNIFVAGGGMNAGLTAVPYKELKPIIDRLGFTEWKEFKKYLIKGNIDQQLKNFIINHRNDETGHDYDSEYREFFKWYFLVLHPDENVGNLTSQPPPKQTQTKTYDEIETLVKNTYQSLLGRDADPDGLRNYSNAIKNGQIKTSDLEKILKASTEYQSRARVMGI
jgi:hypothetical protein